MKKQISNTQVRTIRCGDFKTETWIYHNGYSGVVEETITSPDLVIPLPVKVSEDMSFIDRISLFTASLHLMFYSAQIQKQHYYTGGWFGYFLIGVVIVIAIVVTYLCWGSCSPATVGWVGSMASAIAAATGVSIAVATLMATMLIGLALSLALRIIMMTVKNTALKLVLSAVAMVIAFYAGGGFDAGAWANVGSSVTTASQIATMASQMVDIYVKDEIAEVAEKMKKLASKSETFQTIYSETMESFNKILNELNSGIDVQDIVELTTSNDITSSQASKTISPSAFFAGIYDGYTSFDVLYRNGIEDYCSRTLQLGIIE
jgi:hypothetical protein